MTFDEYKEEILNGERIEWYDTMVPKKLVTPQVHALANMVRDSLLKMESEVSDMRKSKEKDSKERYIESRWSHIRTLPYHSNGLIADSYMAKYRRIIEEDEKKKEKTKPKTRKVRKRKAPTKPKVEKKVEENKEPTPVVKGKRGKNSKLIFGK
jgi:hypothetical protein